jgi:hypothetical protein
METRWVEGIRLLYDAQECETADLIEDACERAIELCRENWGLGAPADCRIYVMTSWFPFFFRSSPWTWRIMLGLTVPLWAPRARRTWPISAAWTQRYGHRVAIGVKPPRLLEAADHSAGLGIFIKEPDMNLNVQQVTCHELVHACSAHLQLPAWLNEGIATVTADRFIGGPTIRPESLELLERYRPKEPPLTYRALSRVGVGETFKYHAVRGYWLVRYLEDVHPGYLEGLFSRRSDSQSLEVEIAAELGLDRVALWREIDGKVVDHFKAKETTE